MTSDFYEIDFVKVGEKKSGDAIALRYCKQGDNKMLIHIVDGGFENDGQKLIDHVNDSYDAPKHISCHFNSSRRRPCSRP